MDRCCHEPAVAFADFVTRFNEKAKSRSVTFRASALRIQTIDAPQWIIAGPAETGKTFAALYRLDELLRTTPKAKAAIVRKVRADMDATVLNTWRRIIEIHGQAQPFGGELPQWYEYPNGSRCYIAGLDRAGKVLSGEFAWIYVNQAEELTISDWETLSTRSTGRGFSISNPMLFGDCNPTYPEHWILKAASEGSLTLLESRHVDNPSLYDEAGNLTEQGTRTMERLDALSGIRFQRLRLGKWVSAEGIIYET